jgi:hypothetical protein
MHAFAIVMPVPKKRMPVLMALGDERPEPAARNNVPAFVADAKYHLMHTWHDRSNWLVTFEEPDPSAVLRTWIIADYSCNTQGA